MNTIKKLVPFALLVTGTVVADAQTWVRDGIGRDMEFVQHGGAASKYSFMDGADSG